jgi:hypothetical protein
MTARGRVSPEARPGRSAGLAQARSQLLVADGDGFNRTRQPSPTGNDGRRRSENVGSSSALGCMAVRLPVFRGDSRAGDALAWRYLAQALHDVCAAMLRHHGVPRLSRSHVPLEAE